MSVKVDLDELAATMRDYRFAYLLTVSDDQRAHAVAVTPVVADGVLTLDGLGNRTLANLTARPQVTLLFPPAAPGGYSLIVDGRAEDGAERSAQVTPSRAVLHRPADHGTPSGATGCGNDCVPVGE
jgi:hypothetical protein